MADAVRLDTKVTFRSGAAREILNSPGMVSAVGARGQILCGAANAMAGVKGASYATNGGRAGRKRAHAIVHTANFAAMVDQHKNHTLNRAIGRDS